MTAPSGKPDLREAFEQWWFSAVPEYPTITQRPFGYNFARIVWDAALAALATPDTLAERVAELEARLSDWHAFRDAILDMEYHAQAMGCGLEDRMIHDRYDAMRYGWDELMERVREQMLEDDAIMGRE